TIPATTLFATCVVYGRLAADNEILAIKAAGINVLKVIWPGLFLGLVMSLATMGLYYRIIPYTHGLLRSMFLNDVEESLYTVLRRDQKINEPRLPYAVWVRQVQGRKLVTALFKRRSKVLDKPADKPQPGGGESYDIIALAREAELRVDMPKRMIHLRMRNGVVILEGGASGSFEERTWDVPLPSLFGADRPRRPRDLSWREILDHRREMQEVQDNITLEVATCVSLQNTGHAPTELPKHISNLQEKIRYTQSEILSLDAELYMRPALAFGCLCFVLVGCPVGIWFGRSDYL